MFNISRGRVWGFATAVPVGALLVAIVPLLTAFEAHVVNVTAKIERRPVSCDARSLGYWANHDGCSKGGGESIHAQKIREISQGLMGAFAHYTGEEICAALWMPHCGPGGVRAGQRCRARAHALADLSNIAAGVLDTAALIAAADDGTIAFDKLGLTPYSSVDEALTAIELIILDSGSSAFDLRNAAYVAQRIYAFYEEENPFAPRCIYDPDDVPFCFERASDKQFRRENATTSEEVLELTAAAAATEILGESETGDDEVGAEHPEESEASDSAAADSDESEGAEPDAVDSATAGEHDASDVAAPDLRGERESRAHTGEGRRGETRTQDESDEAEGAPGDASGGERGERDLPAISAEVSEGPDTSATTTIPTADGDTVESEPPPAACETCESAPVDSTSADSAPADMSASVSEPTPPLE